MPHFVSWRVVIGKDISVGHVKTHSYQSQLVMWRIVIHSCTKSCVPSIIRSLRACLDTAYFAEN